MEEYITPERMANAIMQDSTYDRYYLLVEGNKDYLLYSRFVSEENIRIKEAFGCSKVIDVFNILSSRGFDRKIAIIDSDFRKILNSNINIDGIFQTDDHDIEVMIMKTSAMYDVIKIYCTKDKIDNYQKTVKRDVRGHLFELALELGKLKLSNKIHDFGLIFKPKRKNDPQINYKLIFDTKNNLNFAGIETLIDLIIKYSRDKSERIENCKVIAEKVGSVNVDEYDISQLINGHDLTNLLFLFIKKILTSKKPLVDYNDIEDSLTLAYDSSDFIKTDLYKNIDSWAKKVGVSILKI